MNAANEELMGMMKTTKIDEIDVCLATRLVLPIFLEFFISISDSL
jgi:membrane protein insertase Oxa1/YidC/SpoIIIJ